MSRKNGSPNYLGFEFDKEVTVTLAEDRGRLGSNDYGEFFARNFTDGRFTCASPDLERRLIDSGARRGSVVSITKQKYGRSAVWVVKVLGAQQPEPAKVQPIKVNGHANGHATPAEVTWAKLPAEKYAPSPADAQLTEKLRESIAMVQTEKAAARTAVQAVEPLREPKNLLERAAVAAIDCAILAESYAAKHGRPFTVPAESVCSWASTLFINAR